jgi:DNA-binding PucR family transcriptional regulator
MLTVRDLLRDIEGVSVVTGEANLDNPVRWVHISELTDPTPWLSGGELLLTTGLQLGTPKQQREFVGRLADHQLAGLGIGTGFAHAEMPPALVKAAEERGFPVFEVPYDVPFIAVTEKAFTRLVNEQYAVLQRALSAHERLERLVLSERGLDAVAGALASLIGGVAAVLDPRGELLARRTFRRPLSDEALAAVQDELRERARSGERRSFAPAHEELAGRALLLPVAATGTPDGSGSAVPQAWLLAAKDHAGLTEFDRLVVHQAVTIVALELLRSRIAEDTERRLAGDILSDLISGELSGPDLVRRLEPFGIASRVSALVLLPARGRSADAEARLQAALRDEAVRGLVAAHGQHVVALLPGLPDEEGFALSERLHHRISEDGSGLPAGAGRAVPTGDARKTFHEARCALEARALAGHSSSNGNGNGTTVQVPAGQIATYRDLGSFQLLLSLQDDDALRLFCDSILGPIESGEGHYGGELMRSLEAFIEENGQWERAARRLYCHRHTLRYRIRKVEELTGRDLSSARDRIEFWLALRGRELVR